MPFPLDPNSPQVREFNAAVGGAALSGVARRIRDRNDAASAKRQKADLVTPAGADELRSLWGDGAIPEWPS